LCVVYRLYRLKDEAVEVSGPRRAAGAADEVIAQPINHKAFLTMKTTRILNLLAAALAAGLSLTGALAANVSPAETKAIAEEGFSSTVWRS
jgi:hypothetical protein